jgi:hypothetical protein
MGAQRVKNISEPIPVYRVKLDGVRVPAKRKPQRSTLAEWAKPIAAAMALLVGLAAASWYGFVRGPAHPVAATHVPTIAVLPFDDMSPDKSLGYLGDGPPGPAGRGDPLPSSRRRKIPSNTHFNTTRGNIEPTGSEAIDLPAPHGPRPSDPASVQGQYRLRAPRKKRSAALLCTMGQVALGGARPTDLRSREACPQRCR